MMKLTNHKQRIAIALVLMIGVLLAGLILRSGPSLADEHGHEGQAHKEPGHKEEKEHKGADKKDEHDHAHAKAGDEKEHAGHTHEHKENQPHAAPSVKAGHAATEEHAEQVTMTVEKRKQNGIATELAGPANIHSTYELTGEIALNQDSALQVVPRLAGVVESVAVKAGEKVGKGQLLAVLSSQPLADLRSEVLAAQKRHALANSSFMREKKLWEEKISAEQDYLLARNQLQEAEITLQNARQKLASLGTGLSGLPAANSTHADSGKPGNLSRYEIRAPLAGTITEKQITVGQALKEDAPIFHIADLSTVWVELNVPAKDLHQIKQGQSAQVKAGAFAAEANGKLSYVGALIGSQSRSAKARLVLPNTKGIWYPGLAVNVTLLAEGTQVPVAVRNQAIQNINEQPTVFALSGDQLQARAVVLGRSDGQFTEVLSGFPAGQAYVTSNSFLLKAEIGKSAAGHEH